MDRRRFIFGGLAALGAVALGGFGFVHTARFGRAPQGERLRRIEASPHYHNGRFECLEPVTSTLEGETMPQAFYKMIFDDKTDRVPAQPIPTQKTDLRALPADLDCVVWLGHSSYYLQLAGRRILIDPVFSAYGSPIWFINRAFAGSSVYSASDMPLIDVLLMSHDHWDHLDYPTVMALREQIKDIVCPLGVGEYFEQWGFDLAHVHEEDWFTAVDLGGGLSVHVLPSQHFSGRFLTQNNTEWCGFALTSPMHQVYLSGDGGWGGHFRSIGAQFGGFDLAIMENGQYNQAWHRIHLLPEETVQAAVDVGARRVLLAHNSKFALARHKWYEPMQQVAAMSDGQPYALLTPEIGQLVTYDSQPKDFARWWENTL